MLGQQPIEEAACHILSRYAAPRGLHSLPEGRHTCSLTILLSTIVDPPHAGRYHSGKTTKGLLAGTRSTIRLQVPFSAASGASEDYENETFVWGTNIRAQKVSRDFVNFFELFMEQGGFEAKYIKLMREVRSQGSCRTTQTSWLL